MVCDIMFFDAMVCDTMGCDIMFFDIMVCVIMVCDTMDCDIMFFDVMVCVIMICGTRSETSCSVTSWSVRSWSVRSWSVTWSVTSWTRLESVAELSVMSRAYIFCSSLAERNQHDSTLRGSVWEPKHSSVL